MNKILHTLDKRQHRTGLPERKEARDIEPMMALVFHLEAFPDCSAGKRIPLEGGSLDEFRKQKPEFGEAKVFGIFR